MIGKNQKDKIHNRIAIALGDPAGIGTEVTLKALGSLNLPKNMQPILIGCKQIIEKVYERLKEQGISSIANPQKLLIENIPYQGEISLGEPNAKTGEASFFWLTRATQLVLEGKAKALVTGPISKYIWKAAGHNYPGQTERLGELVGGVPTSMLFTAKSPVNKWRLNTLLATTHIPLNEVSKALTPDLIFSKLDTLLAFCKIFKPNPTIAIAGLNPHSGENGHLGLEEIEWIIPTIQKWQKEHPSIILKGPISPDTCWISSGKAWFNESTSDAPDGILALYHDQGLIPTKVLAFDKAVNTTLGLPFIRTSPDHGTGFDIAKKFIARPDSMIAALETAWELSI